ERRGRASLGRGDELGALRLGFRDPRREQRFGLGPRTLGSVRRFLDEPRGPFLGLRADVVARLARGAQQPRGLLAEGIEQLLFRERTRRAQLLLERVERRLELLLTGPGDRELLRHAPQEPADFRLAEAAYTF